MPSFPAALLTLILSTLLCHGQQPPSSPSLSKCPLLGPQYPVPTALATAPTFLSTTENFTSTLNALLDTAPFNTTSFSLSVFSTTSPDEDEDLLAWQYHHTTPLLASSTQGTQSLDADSIYRIASISKLMTVYLFLIEVGDGHWTEPVAKWIPELERFGADVEVEGGRAVPNWTEITLGDLAGQTSGLVRDCECDLACRLWPVRRARLIRGCDRWTRRPGSAEQWLPSARGDAAPASGTRGRCAAVWVSRGQRDVHPVHRRA